MEKVDSIVIACQGATTVDIADLHDLQGNLKELTEESYVKLRNSIVEFGFSFPIFYWQDQTGAKWIIDAHQRTRTLLKMRDEGVTIPPLPADPIFAKDKTEAKKKLLVLNNRHGRITREGYDEFIDDPTALVVEAEITDFLDIPEVEEPHAPKKAQESSPQEDQSVTCPSCGTSFTL